MMNFKALVAAVAGMGVVGLVSATEVVVMQGGTEVGRGTLQSLSQPSADQPLTVIISGTSQGGTDSARTFTWSAGSGGTVAAVCNGATCAPITGSSYSATCGGATACPTIQLTAAPSGDFSFRAWSGSCAGQGATCTVTLPNGNATASFNPLQGGGEPGTCGPTPSNVTIEEAGALGTTWPQVVRNSGPDSILSFKITTPSAGAAGTFTATKTSAARLTKLLSVSTCPGDYKNPVGAQGRCVVFSTESSLLRLTTNQAAPSYYCKLEPGQTYYVNAVSRENLDSTTPTCSTSVTNNCTFFPAHN